MNPAPRVSVIVPTRNGAATLPPLLAALGREGSGLEIVAIDSDSTDATRELLVGAGAQVLDLGGERFGHGSARNRAAAAASGEILLFLTQDVEPVGDGWLAPLVAAFDEPVVAGAFGRQVPRGASPEEAFLAGVNYSGEPRRLTARDLDRRFGPGATFFSSAFGAVRRAVWVRQPFPDIVMSEDQAWGMAALRAGHEIRYVPEAAVYHGHRFPLARVFRRNFDSGSSLAELGVAGGAWTRGLGHLARELSWIAAEHGVGAVPHAIIYEAVRMLAFQCGRLERRMPRAWARRLGEAPRG
ncbi:MAG: glycosyltransferase family 2 protein [Gemmatimonadetes bacterium]|nr:glycosyltransferase family 2 protein [Gemmatimonadota bacterium]